MNNDHINKNATAFKIDIKPSMDMTDGQLFQLEPDSLTALREVAARFERGRMYKEKEVNEILKAFHDDHVTLRRFLIEHGLLDRNRDGSQYWSTAACSGKDDKQ